MDIREVQEFRSYDYFHAALGTNTIRRTRAFSTLPSSSASPATVRTERPVHSFTWHYKTSIKILLLIAPLGIATHEPHSCVSLTCFPVPSLSLYRKTSHSFRSQALLFVYLCRHRIISLKHSHFHKIVFQTHQIVIGLCP